MEVGLSRVGRFSMPWPFGRKAAVAAAPESEDTSQSPTTRFAFKLFRELSRGEATSNLFFSPSSVMLCLALVYELASGETRYEMAETLEIASLDQVGLENEIACLKSAFGARAQAEVSFANSLWLGQHAEIASALEARLRELYDSELTSLDFAAPGAVPIINAWVNARTKGRISRIVSQLSPLAALIAINAVYFKGRWEKPFQKKLTQEAPFHTASGSIPHVPMMYQGGEYSCYEDRHVQIVTLPYQGGVSMIVVLPAANSDLEEFRQNLGASRLESWTHKSKFQQGVVKLPRFKVDYEAELRNTLTALGMNRAFDENRAQFEHVHSDQPPVSLGRVLHRAAGEVNEEGTEARAVTLAQTFCSSAMSQKPPKLFHMVVDRPFLIVIRDDKTQSLLFMGWLNDPR
jgi:serine protease inhibitor